MLAAGAGGCKAGVNSNGAVKVCKGFFKVAFAVPCVPTVVQGKGEIGLYGNCPGKIRNGAVIITL